MSITQKILDADTGDSSLIGNLARHAKQCEAQLAQWVEAADASQQPQAFYDGYSEAQMRAMQAMLTNAKARADFEYAKQKRVSAELEKAKLDTRRLDWLKHGIKFMHEEGACGHSDLWMVYDKDWSKPLGTGSTLREAIDAAIAAQTLQVTG